MTTLKLKRSFNGMVMELNSELGSLKNECNDMVEKKLKKLYPDIDPVTKIEYPDNKMKRKAI